MVNDIHSQGAQWFETVDIFVFFNINVIWTNIFKYTYFNVVVKIMSLIQIMFMVQM